MSIMQSREQGIVDITEQLIEDWLADERGDLKAEPTITAYRKGIDIYKAWRVKRGIQDEHARASDIRDFRSYLTELGYAAQTVNLRLAAVRSFYRWAVNNDRLPYSPASEIRGATRHKSTHHKRDALTPSEVKAVLATCDPSTPAGARDMAILILMAYCALRSIEVHRATIGDLKTSGDRLVLAVQGKGRDEPDDIVIIPRDQEHHIRTWLVYRTGLGLRGPETPLFCGFSTRSHGGPLSLRTIRRIVTAHYEEAGVVGETKTTHSLRHSAITSAIRNGATPMQVQAMARHASFDTTLGYVAEVNRIDAPAEDLIKY